MTTHVFKALLRAESGTGSSRKLRSEGVIPAVIYGANEETQMISLDHNNFMNTISDESVYTRLVTVELDGKKVISIIKGIQRHPYANRVMHVDFQRVDNEREITKKIPLKTMGSERSPGVRSGALLTLLSASIDVRCKPADLPEYLEIDCSKMEASTTLKMSQLVVPEGIKIVSLLRGGKEYDHAVVMVGKSR